jgi:hypothetical protein
MSWSPRQMCGWGRSRRTWLGCGATSCSPGGTTCATAGTSGRRGMFVWDFAEWIHVLASYNRAFDWAGSTAGLWRRVPTAVVGSTNPSHQSARVGASIHSSWLPTLRLDAGDDLGSIVARLNGWKPRVLIGYASMLQLLAEEQLAGRLTIAPRFVQLATGHDCPCGRPYALITGIQGRGQEALRFPSPDGTERTVQTSVLKVPRTTMLVVVIVGSVSWLVSIVAAAAGRTGSAGGRWISSAPCCSWCGRSRSSCSSTPPTRR